MGERVKPHSWKPSSASSQLSIHKGSRVISKLKPKIRIVHIYAPEIIKTDAENFRELVQRLMGKPVEMKDNRYITRSPRSKNIMTFYREPSVTTEMHTGFFNFQNGERIKEEDEEMWRSENLSGFFDGFSDLDGFIEELSELAVH